MWFERLRIKNEYILICLGLIAILNLSKTLQKLPLYLLKVVFLSFYKEEAKQGF
jgi:hypothetical protein